jgi:hypothetical protein
MLNAAIRGNPNFIIVGEFPPEQSLRLEGLLENVDD